MGHPLRRSKAKRPPVIFAAALLFLTDLAIDGGGRTCIVTYNSVICTLSTYSAQMQIMRQEGQCRGTRIRTWKSAY